jgi:hypothetical protein
MSFSYDLMYANYDPYRRTTSKRGKTTGYSQGKSLTSIIEDSLRESLLRQHSSGQREPVRLITFRGKGLLPGVDLDDSAALLGVMESSDDPD